MQKQTRIKTSRGLSWLPAVAMGLFVLGRRALDRRRVAALRGSVVMVTGGSRGLGLKIAKRFADAGCKLVIFARDEEELEDASYDLKARGAEVLTLRGDVSRSSDVRRAVAQAEAHFGRVDVLINNAGIISVAPVSSTQRSDFERALEVMFWGPYNATMATLPGMLSRRRGRIVNIASVGGRLSVPHMLPYGCAKFALMGLSEGLRSELAKDGISVTTVVPGLMRTGSYVHAEFGGDKGAERRWFSLSASSPLLAMDAGRAAQQIVLATARGDAFCTLTASAKLASLLHGLAPGLTTSLASLANRFLLPSDGAKRRGGLRAGEGASVFQPVPILDLSSTLS